MTVQPDIILGDIRDAIVATLSKKSAIKRVLHCYARDPGGKREYPCLIVEPGDKFLRFQASLSRGGGITILWKLQLYAANPRTPDGVRVLDDLLSFGPSCESSIFNALRDDRTLGGKVTSIQVIDADGPDPVQGGTAATVYLQVQP